MKGHEITYLLKESGHRVTDIALMFGVQTNAVSQVIHGRAVSKRIRQAISKAVGKSVSDLWPDQVQQGDRQ